MPVVQISVPAGALTGEQKRRMVAEVTDVVVDVEGVPQIRSGTYVLINEVPDGGWGIGGKAWTLEEMTARVTGNAAAPGAT